MTSLIFSEKLRGAFGGDRTMVVKVQLSLFTSEEKRQCMVNSKDGSVIFIMTVTDGVLKIMGHDVKAFFHAEIKNGLLEIGGRAPWQEW